MGVNEGNYAQMLYKFIERNYPMSGWPPSNRCPYDLEFGDEDLSFKQFLTWLMYEWQNPATGTTIVAEFVAKKVRNPTMAAKILQTQMLFFDTFEILEKHHGGILVARAKERRKTYRILTKSMSRASVGDIFEGLIHPWDDDGTHSLCGIARLKLPDAMQVQWSQSAVDPEAFERQFDDIKIPRRFRASSVLLAYPEPFLECIYKMQYGKPGRLTKRQTVRSIAAMLTTKHVCDVIEMLPEDDMEALSRVVRRGGSVGYDRLKRAYEGDDTHTGDWPHTTLGLLRSCGLVLVGRDESGRRVAAVATDVMAALKRYGCVDGLGQGASRVHSIRNQ